MDGYRCKRKTTATKRAGTFTSSCPRFADDEGVNVTPLCFINYIKIISDS